MVEQRTATGESLACGLSGTAGELDSAAFEAFYNATAAALCAYIRRISGNPAAAEDILQEAFYRFLRGSHRGMDEAQMRSYVYRAATTIVYDQYRRSRLAGPAAPTSAPAPDPSARIDMERALAELVPRDRALLWLAYVEGASHAEIGVALGMGRLSVRVLLFRARGKLARILRR